MQQNLITTSNEDTQSKSLGKSSGPEELMKQCSFFCAGWWPFILLPLLLLLPLLFFNWHPIEDKVAQNTTSALNAAGIDWVEVETFNQGRDVILSGTAASQEAIDKALSIAKKAEGVRVASFQDSATSIAVPAAPELNANASNGIVTLTGVLTSQGAIDKVVDDAKSAYGASNVVNKLIVGTNTADQPSVEKLLSTLAAGGLAGDFDAKLAQNQLLLKGVVGSDQIKTSIGQQVERWFDGDVLNQLTVVAPAPVVAATPAPVQRNVCADLVKELLASEKIYFETSKATINQQSYALLDNIAGTAKRCADAEFEVAGHTDSMGSLELNMGLSQARAQSVVDYLTNLGLSSEQFSAAGYGPNQPIADNSTAEGRAANRRIEFKLKN